MESSKTFSRFWWRWGPLLLMMSVIFIASSLPSNEIPNFGIIDLTIKKLGHLVSYGLLAVFALRGIGREKPAAYRNAWLIAVAYAISDELHQGFIPGRWSTPIDVGIDALGALIGLWIIQKIQKNLAP